MSTVYRDVRYTRERSPSSEDEKYKSTTVRRYKVGSGGGSVTRVERYEDDDDVRSRYSHSHVGGRPSGDVVEVDRRVERTTYTPDRPRSAFDPPSSPRDREFEYYREDGDRYRSVKYEREREVDKDYHGPERVSRTKVVEESRDVSLPRARRYPWEDAPETELRIEKRVERRSPDGDVKIKEKVEERREEPRDTKERELRIERRVIDERDPFDEDRHHHHHHHDHHHDEVERYRKEVEYYSSPNPPPAPIVIRQKAPEQNVIVHEAPSPAPIIFPPQRSEPNIIVLRDEHREVTRHDDRRAEAEYWRRREELDAMERYERRRRDERDYESDGVDEDYYVKRTVIKRERSDSDEHKKRHLAEGALAGAGLGALISGRKDSEHHDHRGRKVLAGAALGALGTEVVRRARSAYEDRHFEEYDDYEDDDRHRHRSKSRSRLKTGLAIVSSIIEPHYVVPFSDFECISCRVVELIYYGRVLLLSPLLVVLSICRIIGLKRKKRTVDARDAAILLIVTRRPEVAVAVVASPNPMLLKLL